MNSLTAVPPKTMLPWPVMVPATAPLGLLRTREKATGPECLPPLGSVVTGTVAEVDPAGMVTVWLVTAT